MKSAPIMDKKNVSTDSGVTFLHPCDYSYQHYIKGWRKGRDWKGVTSENLFKCFIVLKDMGYLCFVVIMGYPFIHEGRINPFNVCSKIKTSSD